MDSKAFFKNKNLYDITQSAGDGMAPPSDTPPDQGLPTFVRNVLRYSFLPFVLLDQSAKRIAKRLVRPPFTQTGSCKKRGNCCYYITMRKRSGLLNTFQLFWMTRVHRFFLRTSDTFREGGKTFYLLGCRNLRKNGTCKEYRVRPSICREWPVIEHFGYPKLLKGCGFTFIAKNRRYQHVVEEYAQAFQQSTEE